MTRKLLTLALTLLLSATFLMSMTVEEIINKSLEAAGGSQKYADMKSLKMVGKMNMMGMEIKMTLFNKKPCFRMEQEMMGQKMISAYNGKTGWMINPMTGSSDPQEVPEEMMAGMKKQADMGQNPIAQMKADGITSTLEGKETVDGVESYKIKMVTKEKEESFLFINSSTYLPLKITSKQEVMGNMADVEMLFKDYKTFSGITFATKMEMNASGQAITIIFDSIEPNAAIDDSLFEMPK